MSLSQNQISKFPAIVFHKAISTTSGKEVAFNLNQDPTEDWRIIFAINDLFTNIDGVKTITIFTKEKFDDFYNNTYLVKINEIDTKLGKIGTTNSYNAMKTKTTDNVNKTHTTFYEQFEFFRDDHRNKLNKIVHPDQYGELGTGNQDVDSTTNTFYNRYKANKADQDTKLSKITSRYSSLTTNATSPNDSNSGTLEQQLIYKMARICGTTYANNNATISVTAPAYNASASTVTSWNTSYNFESNVKANFTRMYNFVVNCLAEAKRYTDQECLATLPIGSIIPVYSSSNVSTFTNGKYLLCDGAAIPSGTAYATLRNVLPSTYLPDLISDYNFIGGGPNPGQYFQASAPNITGYLSPGQSGADSYGGAFYKRIVDHSREGGSNGNGLRYYFDASYSNSVYGRNNNNLHPNFYSSYYYIKYK